MNVRHWDPMRVRAVLEARGYDVDPTDARTGSGGSLSARRDRGDLSQLVVIDAGGRFRLERTSSLGESRLRATLAAVPVMAVTETQRLTSITGTLPDWSRLGPLLEQFDAFG